MLRSKTRVLSFFLLAGVLHAAEAPKVTFLRDVAPILNKTGCTSGPVSRRGQRQERLQALAARLRPAVRLRSPSLRSVRPPFQSRRPGEQPDAGQADAAGSPRRRPALRDRFRLLQDHLQLDRPGRPLRRSGEGYGAPSGSGAEGDVHERSRRIRGGEGLRHLRRWRPKRRHRRSRSGEQCAGRGGGAPTRRSRARGPARRPCWCVTRGTSPRCR